MGFRVRVLLEVPSSRGPLNDLGEIEIDRPPARWKHVRITHKGKPEDALVVRIIPEDWTPERGGTPTIHVTLSTGE